METDIIDHWLAHAESVHGADMAVPLFFDENASDKLMTASIKKAAVDALKASTGNKRITLHHARHAAANRIALAIGGIELKMWSSLDDGAASADKESAWKMLIDFAVSLKMDIPESGVPSHLHIAWMVGANRQIVMWEEWQFALMRMMLEYFGVDQSRCQIFHTGRIEPELIERAEKYEFKPLPQKCEKGTIQIDTACFGDNKLVDIKVRCAAVWVEDDESVIRSSFELIAMFCAFAFSTWQAGRNTLAG